MVDAFVAALKTPHTFITMTVDQSAKWVAEQRLGVWGAGGQPYLQSDVWMFVGANPLVSMIAAGGPHYFLTPDPVKVLKERRAQGRKLIVIDPRRSETARFADLFLQPRPGRDAELMASILHVILREGWQDHEFCNDYVDGLDDLRRELEAFSPEACADIIGVTAREIVAAATLFARDAKTGMAGSGTGPNMARHSNLAEHLIQALNVVCGRYPRAGEKIANSGVLMRARTPKAHVVLPERREWEHGPKTRKHGLGPIKGTMMSAEIADEILYPAEGRLRALVCIGGNLAVALPDQAKAERALKALELLIVIDPRLTATARFAHYVFAPKVQFERSDHTASLEVIHPVPFAHVTPALVPPPRGSDLLDDWYPLWSFARSCGLQLKIGGKDVPMDVAPSVEELHRMQTVGAPVPFDEVRTQQGGQVFVREPVVVEERSSRARFQLMPSDVLEEIHRLTEEMRAAPAAPAQEDTLQLTVRRHRETNNSTQADFDATWKRLPGNPAYFHPTDMARLGLKPGDAIEVVRGQSRVAARVAVDIDVRPGVVSVGHCRPGLADRPWEATNALVDADKEVQAINRMPIMTGMFVTIERLSDNRI
jgi:anaerobic selenocysteine-containing dehydrogenase